MRPDQCAVFCVDFRYCRPLSGKHSVPCVIFMLRRGPSVRYARQLHPAGRVPAAYRSCKTCNIFFIQHFRLSKSYDRDVISFLRLLPRCPPPFPRHLSDICVNFPCIGRHRIGNGSVSGVTFCRVAGARLRNVRQLTFQDCPPSGWLCFMRCFFPRRVRFARLLSPAGQRPLRYVRHLFPGPGFFNA